jgi:hypothetical protein
MALTARVRISLAFFLSESIVFLRNIAISTRNSFVPFMNMNQKLSTFQLPFSSFMKKTGNASSCPPSSL